ncbi:MAG: hypothetical protein RLZZ426_425 [Actinomycetota bacterium]
MTELGGQVQSLYACEVFSTQTSALKRSDRLIRAGGALVVLGMVLTLIAISPLLFGGQLPSAWWTLSMITGVGLIVLLIGLRTAGSTRSRLVRDALHK